MGKSLRFGTMSTTLRTYHWVLATISFNTYSEISSYIKLGPQLVRSNMLLLLFSNAKEFNYLSGHFSSFAKRFVWFFLLLVLSFYIPLESRLCCSVFEIFSEGIVFVVVADFEAWFHHRGVFFQSLFITFSFNTLTVLFFWTIAL